MAHDWIIDVLADLKSFARQNDLPLLSEQLDDCVLVAATELASKPDASSESVSGDGNGVGDLYRAVTANENSG